LLIIVLLFLCQSIKKRVDDVLQGKVPDISATVEQQSNIISLLLEKVTESENRISYLVEEINRENSQRKFTEKIHRENSHRKFTEKIHRENSQRGQVFDYANSLKKTLHVAIEEKKLKDLQLRESIKKIGELNVKNVNRRRKDVNKDLMMCHPSKMRLLLIYLVSF